MAGRQWAYLDLLSEYAGAMKLVAGKENIPLIDLHKASIKWIISLGREAAKQCFYPGDYTRPNDFGGFVWAVLITELIRNSGHPDLFLLKEKLKTTDEINALDIPGNQASTESGWLYPPKQRTIFPCFSENEAILTYANALQMAQEGYGWFMTGKANNTKPPLLDLMRAAENGYLPPGFPNEELDRQIGAQHLKVLMLMSCQGRNKITDRAARLAPPIEPITGKDAVAYVL